jgi:hypothetical protein
MYSSKHTTHSFCRPPYLLLHSAKPFSRFSDSVSEMKSRSSNSADELSADELDAACPGTSEVVLDLGRERECDLDRTRRELAVDCRRGVVGEAEIGEASAEALDSADMV